MQYIKYKNEASSSYLSRVFNFLLYLILATVQLKNGQLLCTAISIALALIVCIKHIHNKILLTNENFLILVTWAVVVVYFMRFSTFSDIEGIIEWRWLCFGLVFLFIGLTSDLNTQNYACTFLIICSIVCTFALLDFYGILQIGTLFTRPYGRGRMMGGFDGPNEFGSFYLIILSYIWTTIVAGKRIRFCLTLSVPIVWATILTWSRSTLLVLAFLVGVLCLYYLRKSSVKKRLVIILLYVIVLYFTYMFVLKYITPAYEYVRSNRGDRDYLIDLVLKAFWKNPIFGNGLGSFMEVTGASNATPHSEYYLFLASGGILGLGMLLFFFARLLATSWKKRLVPETVTIICIIIIEGAFNNLVRGRVSIAIWLIVMIMLSERSKTCCEENKSNYKK